LLFFLILIVFFSLYWGVLGLGNFNVDGVYRDQVKAAWLAADSKRVWTKGFRFPEPEVWTGGEATAMTEF